VASVIVPESLIALAGPAAVTDPLRVPLAPVKVPVPPTITSLSVPEPGSAGLGWHPPEQVGLLKNSSIKTEPPARLMVRNLASAVRSRHGVRVCHLNCRDSSDPGTFRVYL
jgi:hypothetical protein